MRRQVAHDFVRDGEWRCGCGAINSEDDTRCWQCESNIDGTRPATICDACGNRRPVTKQESAQ